MNEVLTPIPTTGQVTLEYDVTNVPNTPEDEGWWRYNIVLKMNGETIIIDPGYRVGP